VGKVDIYANQSLGLMAFRKNVSFFAIDMDRLALDDPAMTKQVCQEVAEAFAKGHYHCLPVSTFPMADIKKALGLMRAGKHVGKVVLLNYDEQGAPLPCPVERPLRVMRNGATYLLTGSNGGFATRLAIYAMQQGVRHFILANRSSDELSPMAKSLSEDLGVRYTMVKADTSIEADVLRLLEVARAHDPPITTIVHCVGVSGDVKVCDFKDGEDFDKVANGKALGAWYLSKHSEDMALENFVVVSSIASLIGGMGNAAYSAANAYLDALIRYRRAKGLPGTTFNMGSVSDAGILVKNIAARRFQRKLGLEFLTANKAIEELELGLHANASQVVTMFFKQQTRQMFPSQAAWSHLHDEPITLGVSAVTGAMSVKEIAAHLAEEIKAITQASEVLPTSSLVNLGLDSFGFIELSGRIQRTFGIDINSLKLSPEQTLQAVAATIHKLQRRGQDGAANADGQGAAQEAQGGATIKVLERGISVGAMMASPSEAGQKKKGPASLQSLLSARPAWSVRSSAQGSAYLLFGATGMVGCHILRDLLEDKARRGPVYCVVFRAVTPEAALQRVVGRMKQLFIWKPEYANAFVALPGDMTKDVWFDLPAPVYERLVVEVGCVIHAACPRKWGAVESGHGDTQTTGVSNVIAFAQRSQAVLHYLSTAWLDILDVVNKEEREMVLTSVAYVAHKRRAEDMLDYACKTTGIQAVAYRQSLISASSKGAFFGDLVLLDNVRVMYALGMITSQSSTFMAIPADAMASWVAAKVLRRRSSTHKVNRLKVRTSTPLAHAIRVKDLCDVAEKLRRKPIDRTATTEQLAAALPQIDGVSLLNDDMTRLAVLMEGSGKELEAKLRKRQGAGGRASQVKLAIMRKLGKTRGQARGQGRSALDYLADYIHANPEVVTESRLVRLIQEWNSQQKRSGDNIRELTTSQ
jgi:thioester reductase-like protein/short-subunit dehydrogenase/acyl carrier protein